MAGQKPMKVRKQEMLELLWESNGRYVHYLDRKVLNRLIKDGKAKIQNTGGGRKTVAMAVATSPKPVVEEAPWTGGPYAKRRGYAEIAGSKYRGKTHGKVRVDLPREERERKIEAKKKMWRILKGHAGN